MCAMQDVWDEARLQPYGSSSRRMGAGNWGAALSCPTRALELEMILMVLALLAGPVVIGLIFLLDRPEDAGRVAPGWMSEEWRRRNL